VARLPRFICSCCHGLGWVEHASWSGT
jgi:hypothetical protein